MERTVSFGLFADFGTALNIIQGSSQPVFFQQMVKHPDLEFASHIDAFQGRKQSRGRHKGLPHLGV